MKETESSTKARDGNEGKKEDEIIKTSTKAGDGNKGKTEDETESSTKAIDDNKGKTDDETETSTKAVDDNKEKTEVEIETSTKAVDDNKEKTKNETETSTKVVDDNKGKIEDEAKSSTKAVDDNKGKKEAETESSTNVMVGNKRKVRGEDELDDTASTDPSNIKKFLDDLSDYENEIKGRILSYEIELKEANYQLVAERLRSDHYPAQVCTTQWDAIRIKGNGKYTITHRFIEIYEGAKEKVIVDLQFQSQFAFNMSKPSYRKLWNYLPEIFVGTVGKLEKIITIFSSAARKRIPQWLQKEYLHSKWLSPNRTIQR